MNQRVSSGSSLVMGLIIGCLVAVGLVGSPGRAAASPPHLEGPVGTTVSLVTSPNPATEGGRFTMTATVTPISGSEVPAGEVTFYDGPTALVVAPVGLSGPAVVTTSRLTMGTHSLTAQYSGNDLFESSTSTVVTQQVDSGSGTATTTALTSSTNPGTFGEVVSYTATVTEAGSLGTPTGSVTFYTSEVGQPQRWIGVADIMGGSDATLELADLGVGTYQITAEYTGDPTHRGSEAIPISQTINPADSTTTIATSLNPAPAGQMVDLTATVALTLGAVVPTGSVTFKEDLGGSQSVLGTAELDGTGVARLAGVDLGVGSHALIAEYAGDGIGNVNPSTSPPISQVVAKNATTTTLTASANSVLEGTPVTLTAIVAPHAFTSTADIVVFRDGATGLGEVPLDPGGRASLPVNLGVGEHLITATYLGNGEAQESTSGTITVLVSSGVPGPGPGVSIQTTTTLGTSANPVAVGQPVSLTAAVGPAGASGGSVEFYEVTQGAEIRLGGSPWQGQAVVAAVNLPLGAHILIAKYSGSESALPSQSAALTQVVQSLELNPWLSPLDQPPGGVFVSVNGTSVTPQTNLPGPWTGLFQVFGADWSLTFQAGPSGTPQPMSDNILVGSPLTTFTMFGQGLAAPCTGGFMVVGPYGTVAGGHSTCWISRTSGGLRALAGDAGGAKQFQVKVPADFESGPYTLQFRGLLASGQPLVVSVGIRIAPAVKAKATSVSGRSRLKVTVSPACKSRYRVRIQRRVTTRSAGSDEPVTTTTWTWRSGTWTIKAGKKSVTRNLPRGTYRAVVAPSCNRAGTTTKKAQLTR